MKTKVLIISILLFVFMDLKAMVVSQGILPKLNKGSALILGTLHTAPVDQAKKDADALVEVLQSFHVGAYIFVEVGENMLTNVNKDSTVVIGDALIGNVAVGIARLKAESKTKNVVIAADERSSMSFEFKFIFESLGQMCQKRMLLCTQGRHSPQAVDPSIAIDISNLKAQIAAMVLPFNLKNYYANMDAHAKRMKAIQQQCLPGNPVVARIIRTYDDAYNKIKTLFKAESSDAKASMAVIKLFNDCDTTNKLMIRLVQMTQMFTIDADSHFATLVFLQNICEHAAMGRNIIMVIGDLHASRLKEIFKASSKEILYDRTILRYEDGGTVTEGDPRVAFKEAFAAAKLFTEYSNFSTLVRYYFQTHCAKCKSAKDLKRCVRCKNVVYCGDTCQKDDWALHSKFCKES